MMHTNMQHKPLMTKLEKSAMLKGFTLLAWQVKKIEAKSKQATAEHVSLKEVLHEYLETFADEDTLWETLDLAHDPAEHAEFTRYVSLPSIM